MLTGRPPVLPGEPYPLGATWDGTGVNPYFAYLAMADAIVTTGDSVNMVSEAASTGKPVHVIDLPGHAPKFEAFHAGLRRAGITRPFTGRLQHWAYPPLNETSRVADRVREMIRARTAGGMGQARSVGNAPG